MSKTVQDRAIVTRKMYNLSTGVISSDLEWPITRGSRLRYCSKANVSRTVHFMLSNCR